MGRRPRNVAAFLFATRIDVLAAMRKAMHGATLEPQEVVVLEEWLDARLPMVVEAILQGGLNAPAKRRKVVAVCIDCFERVSYARGRCERCYKRFMRSRGRGSDG